MGGSGNPFQPAQGGGSSGRAADYGPHQTDRLYGRQNPINVSTMWVKQRARVDPMAEFNDLDRSWRKRYLADLKLTPNDGYRMQVQAMPEYQKANYNWLRQIGRIPFNVFEKMLRNQVGMTHGRAMVARKCVAGLGKGFAVLWTVIYLCVNNNNSWESRFGVKMMQSKPPMDPDSKYYEHQKSLFVREKPDDWYNQGFKKSPIYGKQLSSHHNVE